VRRTGLVDILREYLESYQGLSRFVANYRAGAVDIQALNALIWNGEDSVLFRLKERCHERFRCELDDVHSLPVQREVLFDLAVGALFLETMKLRESLYQEEIFGPKIWKLGAKETIRENPLILEFQKILSGSKQRIEESFEDIEALLAQTQKELIELLRANADDGFVTRYLLENSARVGAVFPGGLEFLLETVYGDGARAYIFAGLSYLGSGFFREAQLAFERAASLASPPASLNLHLSYCRGMSAFLNGDLVRATKELAAWRGEGIFAMQADLPDEVTARSLRLAVDALESIARQARISKDASLAEQADALIEGLNAVEPELA